MKHTSRSHGCRRFVIQPVLVTLALLGVLAPHAWAQTGADGIDVASNKELVHRFVEAQNDRDLDEYDTLLTSGFVRHNSVDDDVRGAQAYKQFMRDHLRTFPDFRADIRYVVAEGNMVAVYGTVSGTQRAAHGPYPATSERFETAIVGFFRIDRGRIAELWVEVNTHDMLTQLGHID